MKIAVIIFTYNRSLHTEKVLEALKNNTILPTKLYIFQDGVRQKEHYDEWVKVNTLIKSVDWCDCEVIVADKNNGLAASIVHGINFVFDIYEAAIILEDDCVTHPQFMEYMTQALERFAGDRRVYSVNGYGWPADVCDNGTDAYFTGRAGSWGWGTWKDRWIDYVQDYRMLNRIKTDEYLSKQFHIWGEDLESHLLGNVDGRCNSWAVFWSLRVIEKRGYCLTPYFSFVDNIGFDGTGVHCGTGKLKQRLRPYNERKELSLPALVEFPDNYEQAYSEIFSWTSKERKLVCYNDILVKWINLHEKNMSIVDCLRRKGLSKISIWGKGQLCDLLLQELDNKVDVLSIIESNPKENSYKGIPIVNVLEIPLETQLIIVIPVYDLERIKNKIGNQEMYKLIGLNQLIEE